MLQKELFELYSTLTHLMLKLVEREILFLVERYIQQELLTVMANFWLPEVQWTLTPHTTYTWG